jgi:hypothetical protein
MHGAIETKTQDAISEIAGLLATAYRRRAGIRLIRTEPEPLPSTEGLENRGETRPHELTLAGQKREETLQ